MTAPAVVFDLGAVLLRWRPALLLARVLPGWVTPDEPVEARLKAFFQGYGGDWGDFDRGVIEPDALAARIAARTGLSPHDVHRVIAAVPEELEPMAETVAIIERLRADGRRLHYLSNMPAPFADHLERAHPFDRWFDGGVFSSRVKLVKPDPAIFRLAEREFGRAPSELVFVDDHPANVAAAREAGWRAIAFEDATQCERELVEMGIL